MPGTGSSVSLDFSNGDTLQRFTITDTDVTASSEILPGIRKRNIADRDDPGYIYLVNVVTVAAGSFDVLVAAVPADADAAAAVEPPNELLSLVYLIR